MRRSERGVGVGSVSGTPAGLEKQVLRVPEVWSACRLSLEANAPSKATRSGGSPKSTACHLADRIVSVESAGVAFFMTTTDESPARPLERVNLLVYVVSRLSLSM